jgi:hypothetical protein
MEGVQIRKQELPINQEKERRDETDADRGLRRTGA